MSRTKALLIGAALVLLPAQAIAGGLFTRNGERAVTRHRTILVSPTGEDRTLIIEQLHVEADAQRMVYLQAFPKRPEITAVSPEALLDLRDQTEPEQPHHMRVERRVFGPSIITALAGPLGDPARPAPIDDGVPRIGLAEGRVEFFSGPITTSTVTGQRFLPPQLDAWLAEQNLALQKIDRDVMLDYCDRGWTIAALIFEAPSGRFQGRFNVGPIAMRFEGSLTYPRLLSGNDGGAFDADLYTAAPTALIPQGRDVIWRERPWAVQETPSGALSVIYSQPADAETALALSSLTGGNTFDPQWLVRGETRFEIRSGNDLGFRSFDDPSLVPGSYRRGSALDLFLCLLLGVTPLFYTPEALLLLWIGYNARARKRPREPMPFAAKLWALYALVVAAYWIATLEGAGRIAALAPLAIAIYQLFIAGPEIERGPVRIDFRRKKGAAKTTKPAPAAKPPVGT